MKVTPKQAFILYSLGAYSLQANERLAQPVEAVISKKVFIDILRKAGVYGTKERALYQLLQELEESHYLSYANHCLALTLKGQRLVARLDRHYAPYLNLARVLDKVDIRAVTKKAQTVFRR